MEQRVCEGPQRVGTEELVGGRRTGQIGIPYALLETMHIGALRQIGPYAHRDTWIHGSALTITSRRSSLQSKS